MSAGEWAAAASGRQPPSVAQCLTVYVPAKCVRALHWLQWFCCIRVVIGVLSWFLRVVERVRQPLTVQDDVIDSPSAVKAASENDMRWFFSAWCICRFFVGWMCRTPDECTPGIESSRSNL